MKHFDLISTGIDIGPLREQLAARPQLWNAHSSRRESDGTPHGGMSDIWVRYRDPADLERLGREKFNEIHVPIWYPAWRELPALQSIIFDLMCKVRGEMLGGVLITSIPSGHGILPHTDTGWHVETYRKFYVTIEGGEGARFFCNHDGTEEFIEPKPGECWEFDNKKLHWVSNESNANRTTLIICIRAEPISLSTDVA